MKPYLTPNPTLAFVVEWGILIISILLVFSPFIYLGFRKWKRNLSVGWLHVIGAYILSFAIYLIWDWWILGKVDKWIYNNFTNTHWLQQAIFKPSFRMIFIATIGWLIMVFFSSVLIKNKPYNLIHFISALAISIAMFFVLLKVWMFLTVVALGQIGSNYF